MPASVVYNKISGQRFRSAEAVVYKGDGSSFPLKPEADGIRWYSL